MAKVLMLVARDVNPDPRVEREASALESQGIDVTVAGLAREGTSERKEHTSKAFTLWHMPSTLFLLPYLGRGFIHALARILLYYLECLKRLPELASGLVAVHSNDFDTLPLGYLVSRIMAKPLVYDAHEVFSGMIADFTPSLILGFIDAIECALAKKASILMTTGHLMRKRYEIMTGRDVVAFRNSPSISFSKVEVGRNRDIFVVGYVGGLLTSRNIPELIEGFLLFAEDKNDVRLEFAGWGPLESFVQEAADENREKIVFHGKLPYSEVPPLMASFSLSVVFTSPHNINHIFACSNKLFESASLKVPILATDIGELAWMVKHEEMGYTIDSRFPNEISDALQKAYDNQDDLRKMGLNAHEAFMMKYSWNRMKLRFLTAYRRLLTGEN